MAGMDDSALAATSRFCGSCGHEAGAHGPAGCASDGESPLPGSCPCRWEPGSLAQPADEPLLCPTCGAEAWRAEYDQAVSQGVYLYADGAGGFTCDDYRGDEDTYDDGSSENWWYRCGNCGHRLPGDAPERNVILDRCRRALRLLQMLDQVREFGMVGTGESDVRLLIAAAQDELGAALSLECNGEPEGHGWYDHASTTGSCPVHEWLDEDDCDRLHEWSLSPSPRAAPVSLLASRVSDPGAPPGA